MSVERRKRFWARLFYTHDRLKYYYTKLLLLFLLAVPFRFLFSISLWVEIMATEESRQSFLLVFYLFWALVGLVAAIVYGTVWRFVFPKYVVVRGNSNYPAGRCYYFTASPLAMWSIRKREWAGAPIYFDQPYVLVCRGLLNPLNPWGSMTKIWLPNGTSFIRDVTEIRVWEAGHKYKRVSLDGNVEYVVEDSVDSVFNSRTQLDLIRDMGRHKMREMIISTQNATEANIPLIQKALEHGSFSISWPLKEKTDRIEAGKQKKEGGVVETG